jgi:hypothetical protein
MATPLVRRGGRSGWSTRGCGGWRGTTAALVPYLPTRTGQHCSHLVALVVGNERQVYLELWIPYRLGRVGANVVYVEECSDVVYEGMRLKDDHPQRPKRPLGLGPE